MFDIHVELLRYSLPEIAVHRLDSSCVTAGVLRPGQNGAADHRSAVRRRWIDQEASGKRTERATEPETEVARAGIHFGVVRRVLPETLSALIPGRVVENAITSADDSLFAAERFPGQSDAWFDCLRIKLNAST